MRRAPYRESLLLQELELTVGQQHGEEELLQRLNRLPHHVAAALSTLHPAYEGVQAFQVGECRLLMMMGMGACGRMDCVIVHSA